VKSLVLPLAAGAGLVAACAALGRLPNLVEAPRAFLALYAVAFLCYAGAVWSLRATRGPRATALVLGVATVARLVLLPAAPTLSTDAYRYLWDARVSRAGISPYAYPPVAPELEALRDEAVFPRLNHPTWHTIYPPGAQLFFTAVGVVAPDSMLALKVALGVAELLGLGILFAVLQALRLPATRAVIYAWNPLLLVEIWGTAHLDALVLPAVVGATWAVVAGRRAVAAGLLAAGTLIKLYPAALLPVLLGGPGTWTAGVVFAAVVAAGYAPAMTDGIQVLGSLPRYLQAEHFNPGIIRSLVDEPALVAAALAAWVACVSVASRRVPLAERAVMLVGGLLVLGGNIFPWYAVWLVPFLAVVPSIPWIAFTGTVGLAYTFFLGQPWAIPWWARVLEFAPLAAGVAWWMARRTFLLTAPERSR
jgi:hypothetical protein